MKQNQSPESWIQASKGYWIALAIAIGTGWLSSEREKGGMTAQVDMMERRLESMERRCLDD